MGHRLLSALEVLAMRPLWYDAEWSMCGAACYSHGLDQCPFSRGLLMAAMLISVAVVAVRVCMLPPEHLSLDSSGERCGYVREMQPKFVVARRKCLQYPLAFGLPATVPGSWLVARRTHVAGHLDVCASCCVCFGFCPLCSGFVWFLSFELRLSHCVKTMETLIKHPIKDVKAIDQFVMNLSKNSKT